MKNRIKNTLVLAGALALFSVAFVTLKSEPGRAPKETLIEPGVQPVLEPVGTQTVAQATVPPAPTIPFIVQDTQNDSPGTNIVTRIVTLTAQVGGAPPFALQWKVDRGSGFVSIPGATNATYRIGNAQVSDAGLYSLFATNDFGNLSTTPVPLIVSEGVD